MAFSTQDVNKEAFLSSPAKMLHAFALLSTHLVSVLLSAIYLALSSLRLMKVPPCFSTISLAVENQLRKSVLLIVP